MKFLMLLFCVGLIWQFLRDVQKINVVDGEKYVPRVLLDTFLIIVFAILERGRW